MISVFSRIKLNLYISNTAALLFFSVLSACAYGDKTMNTNPVSYPVLIFDGLHMGELLKKPEKLINTADVKRALNKDWYSGVTVRSKDDKRDTTEINNCQDYFIASKQGLIPLKEYEVSAYMEFAMMCVASAEIVEAKPAAFSFLSDLTLDKSFPALMPKQFAMVISVPESKKISENNNLIYWADVNKITSVDVKNNYQTVYKHEGAEQNIEFVAKGDFDGDTVEDLLLTSKDSVEGGSFNAIRMLLITKKSSNGKHIVLKEYNY